MGRQQAMWRGLVFAAVVYAAGDPRLDGYRPRVLDRVLQEFHRELGQAAANGSNRFLLFDCTHNFRLVNDAFDRLSKTL